MNGSRKAAFSISGAITFSLVAGLGLQTSYAGETLTCTETSPCTIAATTVLDKLIIEEGGSVTAEDDATRLTLTVDGIQKDLAEGTYAGDDSDGVVITVTDEIPGDSQALYDSANQWSGGMTSAYDDYRTAAYIANGEYSESQSVEAARLTGSIGSSSVSNVKVVSEGDEFCGIIAFDTMDYSINNLTVTATGDGGSDFYGSGAGVAVAGDSDVDINKFVFFGNGNNRQGIYVGSSESDGSDGFETAYASINKSYVRATSDDYLNGSSGCPWMLGISADGTVRATMLDGFANATYNYDILLSDGWGILSTDDVGRPVEYGVYTASVIANNSVVDVTTDTFDDPSAYATYAIGACHNTFNNCVIGYGADSKLYKKIVKVLPTDTGYSTSDYAYDTEKYGLTYAGIIANEFASLTYNNSYITTKYGIMYHKTNNVSYVHDDSVFPYEDGALDNTSSTYDEFGKTVVSGSTVNTEGAAFLIKSCSPNIYVDNSTFNSENGVIVQLMTCDDPGMGASYFSESLDTSSVEEDDGSSDAGEYSKYKINTKDITLYDWTIDGLVNDAQVHFDDCKNLTGDIYNSVSTEIDGEGMLWWGQNLVVYMNHSKITGIISSSTALHNQYSCYKGSGDNEFCDADGNEYQTTCTTSTTAIGSTVSCSIDEDEDGNYITTGETVEPEEGVIFSGDATMLGDVSNEASAAVNNGVLLSLKDTTWQVTGTSYLTGLVIDKKSTIEAMPGYTVSMTVGGEKTAIKAGSYSGDIIITLTQESPKKQQPPQMDPRKGKNVPGYPAVQKNVPGQPVVQTTPMTTQKGQQNRFM